MSHRLEYGPQLSCGCLQRCVGGSLRGALQEDHPDPCPMLWQVELLSVHGGPIAGVAERVEEFLDEGSSDPVALHGALFVQGGSPGVAP